MGYSKSKVLAKIKKVFDKTGAKKAAAAEACKSFGDSKVSFIAIIFSISFLLQTSMQKIVKSTGNLLLSVCWLVQVEIDKELEEKKTELQPKVVEIYEAAPAEIKVTKTYS